MLAGALVLALALITACTPAPLCLPAESGRGGKRKADSSGMPSAAKRSKEMAA